jgi:hypothetical protein
MNQPAMRSDKFKELAHAKKARVRRIAKWAGLGCGGLVLLLAAAAALGVPFVWDLLFGIAYCLDGYGGCHWQ